MPKERVLSEEILNERASFSGLDGETYEKTEKACRYLAAGMLYRLFLLYSKNASEKPSDEIRITMLKELFNGGFEQIMNRMGEAFAKGNEIGDGTNSALCEYFEKDGCRNLFFDGENGILSAVTDRISALFAGSLNPQVISFTNYLKDYRDNNYRLSEERDRNISPEQLQKELLENDFKINWKRQNDIFTEANGGKEPELPEEDAGVVNEYASRQYIGDNSTFDIILEAEGGDENLISGFYDLFRKDYAETVLLDFGGDSDRFRRAMSKRYLEACKYMERKRMDRKLNPDISVSPREKRFYKLARALEEKKDFRELLNGTGTGKLYRVMKAEILTQRFYRDQETVAKEFGERSRFPLYGLTGENSILKNALEDLKTGDKFYRGSSSAYKEIQRELEKLDRYIADHSVGLLGNPAAKLYIDTMFRAIAEKAGNYIESHKKAEIRYSPDSYEGKRIMLMRKVFNRLELRARDFEKEAYYGNDRQEVLEHTAERELRKELKDRLSEMTFSERLYSRVHALEEGAGKNTISAVLENAEKHRVGNSVSFMGEALRDRVVPYNNARNIDVVASRNFKLVTETAEKGNAAELAALRNRYAEKKAELNNGMHLELLDGIFEEVLPEEPAGKDAEFCFTGDRELDKALCSSAEFLTVKAEEAMREMNAPAEKAPEEPLPV